MKRLILKLFIITVFFTGCDTKSSFDESLVAKNKDSEKLSEFIEVEYKLTTTKGEIIEFKSTKEGFEFKDYFGKKAVLIDVFATWCPPCIEALPHLKELREKYKEDFEIVSVLFEKDKSLEEIKDFIEKYEIPYPVTVGEENFVLTQDLGNIQKVPEYFLFSKEGKFVTKFVGKISQDNLERFIKVAVEN